MEWGPTMQLRVLVSTAEEQAPAPPATGKSPNLSEPQVPRDNMGTVMTHCVVLRSKLTVKSFLKRAVPANGRCLMATEVLAVK